jgi:hypothetical protein
LKEFLDAAGWDNQYSIVLGSLGCLEVDVIKFKILARSRRMAKALWPKCGHVCFNVLR